MQLHSLLVRLTKLVILMDIEDLEPVSNLGGKHKIRLWGHVQFHLQGPGLRKNREELKMHFSKEGTDEYEKLFSITYY